MRRTVIYRAITIAALALALAATPSLATAQSLNNVTLASNATHDFLLLDVAGAATYPGAPVIQWYGNAGANQRWNFVQLADGNEEIVNQNSGMCLTSDGMAGHWVYQWPCSGYAQQEWTGTVPPYFGSSHVTASTLKNAKSGLYLDVEGDSPWAGAHLITWSYNNTPGDFFTYYQMY
jgi:hypothetical protein